MDSLEAPNISLSPSEKDNSVRDVRIKQVHNTDVAELTAIRLDANNSSNQDGHGSLLTAISADNLLDLPSGISERLREAAISKQWHLLRKYLEIIQIWQLNPAKAERAKEYAANVVLGDKQSPLLNICALHGQLDLVATLLEIGVDVNAVDQHGKSVLHACAECGMDSQSTDMMTFLISHGADGTIVDKDGRLALHIACMRGSDAATALINLLFPVSGENARLICDKEGYIPFWLAAGKKNTSLLRLLLSEKADEQLSYQNMQLDGDTLAHLFVRNQETGMVKVLIESGTPLNLQNNKGETLLHLAASTGNSSLLESFRRFHVTTDIKDEAGANGCSPLQAAVLNGQAEFLQQYLAMFLEVSLNERTESGQTMAHLAAAKGYVEVLKVLKSNGLSFNIPDKAGRLPLHVAVLTGDETTILAIIKFVSFIDIPTKDGYTALQLAAMEGKHDAIDILLGHGASVDANGGPLCEAPLHLAAKLPKEFLPARNLVLSGANLNLQNSLGQTALHISAASGNAAVAELLLEENALLHTVDQEGNTALHTACLYGNVQVARVILKYGNAVENNNVTGIRSAVLHMRNKIGETPLHGLCRCDADQKQRSIRTEDVAGLAVFLLDRGAIVNARTTEVTY
ncbi:serine/threonine-protein phosphatase 6 regulatory ankyrin repeat subunit B-like [Paramacrobiotus metropolitanus]|uniref:serine/threonine-protein phosphatase 6 regulatory ankyrin repeat subunit B-like n=1 Tax=Paramacrobiotus metropolitanus TaxID=2943436 RepID=UPI002445FEBB|nr:serine/threonine-protein phosphatase 6 regulatory ankyrin repeat subunit B-like [Paramacrobiotus metropolitanus]